MQGSKIKDAQGKHNYKPVTKLCARNRRSLTLISACKSFSPLRPSSSIVFFASLASFSAYKSKKGFFKEVFCMLSDHILQDLPNAFWASVYKQLQGSAKGFQVWPQIRNQAREAHSGSPIQQSRKFFCSFACDVCPQPCSHTFFILVDTTII